MRVSEAAARAARERSFLCACYLFVEKDEPCAVLSWSPCWLIVSEAAARRPERGVFSVPVTCV
jgi:hypothetical protein